MFRSLFNEEDTKPESNRRLCRAIGRPDLPRAVSRLAVPVVSSHENTSNMNDSSTGLTHKTASAPGYAAAAKQSEERQALAAARAAASAAAAVIQ